MKINIISLYTKSFLNIIRKNITFNQVDRLGVVNELNLRTNYLGEYFKVKQILIILYFLFKFKSIMWKKDILPMAPHLFHLSFVTH